MSMTLSSPSDPRQSLSPSSNVSNVLK
jgi:hypothetical protein